MNIDWSKAPKGFDWYFQPKRATGPDDLGGFYRIGGTKDRFVSASDSYILFSDIPQIPELFNMMSRPEPTERDKAIDAMLDVVNKACWDSQRAIFAGLYDAGYRKFEIVEEDL